MDLHEKAEVLLEREFVQGATSVAGIKIPGSSREVRIDGNTLTFLAPSSAEDDTFVNYEIEINRRQKNALLDEGILEVDSPGDHLLQIKKLLQKVGVDLT